MEEIKIKVPRTKKELEEIVKLHGEVRLYSEDFRNYKPGLSSTGGCYGYWTETGPITLENIDKVVWRFHTTYDGGVYCEICGNYHHISECPVLEFSDGYSIYKCGEIWYPSYGYQEVIIAKDENAED